MNANEVSHAIITAAMKVHSALGPGLLESAYERCLAYELTASGFSVRCQVPLPVVYRDIQLEFGYRLDMLVNDVVVVEIKAIEALAPVHKAQLLSYLRMSGKPLGLLINFNVVHLKEGIRRVVNGLDDSTASASLASSAFEAFREGKR